jgi:serine/threonine protein kinase
MSTTSPSVPEKIGKYTISGEAGRGNVGVVYVGHDPFADTTVAIKVCMTDDSEGEGAGRLFRKMFFNEAQTAGSLDNPNILKVIDAGDEDGEPYIVMEYIPGGITLKDYCKPETLLPIERVIELVFKCAKALDYAHRRGVVHRDIKPSNIMMTLAGEVKIGDFGIAQKAHGDVTQVMGIVGSPLYMSPEQACEEELNNQTDIYSLGAVLFELLTGRPPFLPAALTRLIFQLMNEAVPNAKELRPDLPDKLAAVAAKALEKDRSKRYKTCLEMATDLARVAGQLHTEAQAAAHLEEDEKFALVHDLRFFAEFSDSELWEVIHASRWMGARAGQSIIDEGHYDQSFYVIVSGNVAVEKSGTRIGTLNTGDCFGEMSYLTKIRRTATIKALDDVMLIHVTATLMERASVTCQLRFNRVFLQTLIERLAKTSQELAVRPA